MERGTGGGYGHQGGSDVASFASLGVGGSKVEFWLVGAMLVVALIVSFGCMFLGMALFGSSRRRARVPNGSITLIVSALCLLGVVIPAYGTLKGTRTSRLVELGALSSTDVDETLERSLAAFTVVLVFVLLGDLFSAFRRQPSRLPPTILEWTSARKRRALIWALAFAFIGEVALGRREIIDVQGIAERGQLQGAGIPQVMTWLWPIVFIIAVDSRVDLPRRLRYGALLTSLLAMLGGGDRSPLLLVGSYLAVCGLQRASVNGLQFRHLAAISGATYITALLIAVTPAWRADVSDRRFQDQSFQEVLAASASNPLANLAQNGAVDTLDGMLLVEDMRREGVRYSPTRLTDAALLFVPSQVWPAKPTPVSTEVSRDRLGYGASGMFLSGAGYLRLTLGSTVAAAGVFGIVAAVASRRLARCSSEIGDRVLGALVVYFVVRFWSAGDAYDLFHVATVAIAFGLVSQLSRIRWSHRFAQGPFEGPISSAVS